MAKMKMDTIYPRDEKDAMLDMIGKAQYFTEIGETLADMLYNQED